MNLKKANKPEAVRIAIYLLCSTLWIGGLQLFILDGSRFIGPENIITVLCTMLFMLCLFAMINSGKNWARTIYGVLFLIGLPLSFSPFTALLSAFPLSGFLSLIQVAFQAIALFLLYQKPCSAWFKNVKIDGSSLADIKSRECSYCAELILKKARICKHCGQKVSNTSDILENQTPESIPKAPAPIPKTAEPPEFPTSPPDLPPKATESNEEFLSSIGIGNESEQKSVESKRMGKSSSQATIATPNDIAVTCTCGAHLKAKQRLIGKTISCPKCKQPLKIKSSD